MAQINIYSKEGTLRYTCEKLEYQGVFMGACHVSVSIKSAYPIAFAVGDYISYRGEIYTLNYKPDTKKNSSSGTNIDSYTYDNIVFQSVQDETVRCKFRDFVLEDNTIHYTQLSIFTFYDDGSLFQVRDRIQANLDRLYTGANKWTIEVATGVTARDGTAVKDHTYSVSNMSVWDILAEMNTQQKVNFVRKGRTIIIGAQEMLTDKTRWIFGYGNGNMLTSIETQTSETEKVITRMHAYGNSTNMPYRYYNKLWTADDIAANSPISSMNMPRLCLPYFAKLAALSNHPDGSMEYAYYDNSFNTTTQTNAAYIFTKLWKNANTQITIGGSKVAAAYVSDVWIDSVRGIAKYDVKEDDVYFDTDSIENIYPSMKFMIGSNTVTGQDSTNDNGVAAKDGLIYAPDGSKALTFTVTIPNVGFSVFDEAVKTGETPQLSMTSGMCGSRNFDINHMDAIKDVNNNIIGYTLECKRTLDQSLNLYYPYNDYHIKSGDNFTFVNIFMSNSYVEAASSYMLNKALIYLSLHDTNTITIKPTIDNVLMAEQIADEGYFPVRDIIKEGLKLSIIDNDLSVNTLSGVTISSLTIKDGEGDIPEYEITLSDDKEADLTQRVVSEIKDYMTVAGGGINTSEIAAIVKLEGQTRFVSKLSDDVAKGIIDFKKGIKLNSHSIADIINSGDDIQSKDTLIMSVAKQLATFMRKDVEDSTDFIQTFTKGIKALLVQSGNYSTGMLGAGFTLKNDANGDSYIEVDRGLFRKTVTFYELLIQKIKSVGGQLLLSDTQMNCIKVEEQADSYRCYFKNNEDGKVIYNEFEVNDLARRQDFNVKTGSKYYWRKVIAIGDDYIDLSKTDCDAGSGVPEIGDDIIQIGNSSDTARQGAIVLSAYGPDSPYIKIYQGINSYSLSGKERATLSPSKIDITADSFKFSTGDSIKDYIDNNVIVPCGNWEPGTSYLKNRLVIFNNQTFISTADTSNCPIVVLADENGDYLVDENGNYITPTDENGNITYNPSWKAYSSSEALEQDVAKFKKDTSATFEILNDKVDSKVSSTTYNALNEVVEQHTTEFKQLPESFNLSITESVKEGGTVYNAINSSFTMNDDGITLFGKKLKFNGSAIFQDINKNIQSKAHTFTSQPTDADAYNVGDIWTNATYGDTFKNDILKCITAKAAGASFDIAHWQVASKYTDDTVAKQAQDDATAALKYKETFAQGLGFDSYADLEQAAEAGKTIIKGGKINTDLIDAIGVVTKGLVAQMVQAATLQTTHNSGEAYVDIHKGIIDVYGTVARNIQFGVNDQGMAVLKYFNNEGINLYDLGPNGIDAKNLQSAQWEEIQYVRVLSIMQTVPPEGLVSNENATVLFRLNTAWHLTTLYIYHAGKINGTIVSDSANGFTTAADAAAANGKIFTVNSSGHLANDTYTKNNGSSMLIDKNSEEAIKDYWVIQNGVSTSHSWECSVETFNMVNGNDQIPVPGPGGGLIQ